MVVKSFQKRRFSKAGWSALARPAGALALLLAFSAPQAQAHTQAEAVPTNPALPSHIEADGASKNALVLRLPSGGKVGRDTGFSWEGRFRHEEPATSVPLLADPNLALAVDHGRGPLFYSVDHNLSDFLKPEGSSRLGLRLQMSRSF